MAGEGVQNVIARRVMDDLIIFSGETSPSRSVLLNSMRGADVRSHRESGKCMTVVGCEGCKDGRQFSDEFEVKQVQVRVTVVQVKIVLLMIFKENIPSG
ncbi:hypothetical protein Tco_0840115 [Tanacetum coccineum]|uniref:Uncharacterized protein n=1 Tax=Tanacetum coccineum TaxID=301880 RepID=A0ABQ5AWD0_9ASTR